MLGKVVEIHDAQRIPLSAKDREQRKGVYPYYGAVSIVDYVDNYIFDGIYLHVSEDGAYVTDKDGYPTMQYVWESFG